MKYIWIKINGRQLTTDNNKNHNNNNNNERLLDVAAFLSFWPRGPWRASAQPCLQLRADHGCKINGVPDSFYSLYCFYNVAFFLSAVVVLLIL